MKRLKKQVYQATNPSKAKKGSRRGLFGGARSTKKEAEAEAEVERKEEEGRECSICLEAFVANEQVVVTPCKHMFHGDCITPWVKSHGKCPICRLSFCERNTRNTNNINNAGDTMEQQDQELALQVLLLVRAMEEAFNWLTLFRAISVE